MGKPKMVWSRIQLRLINQHKIVPIGRLTRVNVKIDGVRNATYFKVIEIMDDSQPYPALMGLEWAFDNHAIINLKRREIIFEVRELRVTAPQDLLESNTSEQELNTHFRLVLIVNWRLHFFKDGIWKKEYHDESR